MSDEPTYMGWSSFEPTLPGMPDDPPESAVPDTVHITRRRSASLCSDCIAEIHVKGVARAPVPMPQRWQFRKGALTLHLCETHKNRRLEQL